MLPESPGQFQFPADFRWGVATSSHQFEGGNTNNQWQRWQDTGHIVSGDTVGLACNWWKNAEVDFDHAQNMGINALRLSIEWSRIEPHEGKWDDSAITRYRALLQGLHDRNLEPMVTLHHFTNPLWLEDQGAFLNTKSIALFERYVAHTVAALSDLCDFWCTVNEPNVYTIIGYQIGEFPPGHHGNVREVFTAQANMARAHAAAYHAIHRIQPTARVGWAQHYNIFDPARPHNLLDTWAASLQDASFNEFFPHAVATGKAKNPYALIAGDLSMVKNTCDYIGINIYARDLVRFDIRSATLAFGKRGVAPNAPRGDVGMGTLYSENYPEAIVRIVQRVAPSGKPIYITENGIADRSERVRPWVLNHAVEAMTRTLRQGYDLRGYYHWSLVDNFEWAAGWSLRFGLIGLDPVTQQRTWRRSAHFYREIIRARGLNRELIAAFHADQFTPE